MRTKEIVCSAAAYLIMHTGVAQEWTRIPGGDVILTNEWLGADVGSLIPLHLRTIPQLSIDMSTQDIRRFRLLPDATFTFGSYASQTRDGALLLSPDVDGFWGAGGRPFSMLHLAGVGVNYQTQTFRPWMRNGITFTGNSDQGYLGQKCMLTGGTGAEISDRTDMVAHWSGDPGGDYGPDRFRFLFTGGYINAVTSGWHSTEGLEAMRMTPIDSAHVNVGIGDYYAGNLVDGTNITEPSERLDVLNGRVRIRQLPEDEEVEDAYKVMVVDDSSDPLENGVVKWVDPSALIPADCEWTMNPASPNHVYTAVGATDDSSPDDAEAVGIGVDLSSATPTAKLVLYTESYDVGLDVGVNWTTTDSRGVKVLANGGSEYNYGVYSEA